jgi:hypothetical protein
MDTHRVTGILPGREAGTFAQWLRAHPGVRLICRDRADGFALGGREGAPGAQQVADRWHRRDDLGDYMKKAAAAHHGCIKDHYAVLNQTAAEQATDPQRTAGQATAEHAGNRDGTGRRGPLKAGERELPDPGPARRGAVEACGTCRTDVAAIGGRLPGTVFPLAPGRTVAGATRPARSGAAG